MVQSTTYINKPYNVPVYACKNNSGTNSYRPDSFVYQGQKTNRTEKFAKAGAMTGITYSAIKTPFTFKSVMEECSEFATKNKIIGIISGCAAATCVIASATALTGAIAGKITDTVINLKHNNPVADNDTLSAEQEE